MSHPPIKVKVSLGKPQPAFPGRPSTPPPPLKLVSGTCDSCGKTHDKMRIFVDVTLCAEPCWEKFHTSGWGGAADTEI